MSQQSVRMPRDVGAARFRELVSGQEGMVSREQALAAGVSLDRIRAHLEARRWQRLAPGIYATFTGPLPPRSRVWAALLDAGHGAVVTGRTALWLAGAVANPGQVISIRVPHGRSVTPRPGLHVRRCRAVEERRHPVATPPSVRVEEALLDEVERLIDDGEVVGLVLEVLQRRVTRPERVLEALARRKRHRRRRLLVDVLEDATEGVASALEHRYGHDVEQAHGLPSGQRNALVVRSTGSAPARRTRPDLRYPEWSLVLELDGEIYHPGHLRHLDRMRDNDAQLSGERTLRAGWREVVAQPCETASRVGLGLRLGGWPGVARRCGPDCRIDPLLLRPPAPSSSGPSRAG